MRVTFPAVILAATGAALLAGCTTMAKPEMSVVPPFWGTGGKCIRITVVSPPQAGFWRFGGDWFYHRLVSDARDASLIDFLAAQQFSFAEAQQQLEALLARRGFVVVAPPAAAADYEITVSVRTWGVSQDYTGVIPKGTKLAHVELCGEIVDLHTGWALWSYLASGSTSLGLDWKQPPELPRVRAAFASASAAAAGELAGALESWGGTTVSVDTISDSTGS
jgi:hypothetical protein